MSTLPEDLRYADSHEWLKPLGDGTALIGITDYAQSALGDITFVQLPAVGTTLAKGEGFGVVESVKAASDLYAPVSLTVLEVNTALDATPETINSDPYNTGWMLKVQIETPAQLDELLDATAYSAKL
ncbi:glycine cleavage system protein H [Cephaloticoccus primus]|uniref:Glycine cleavage system H protein n=1 Tax=Cephaloticoccus primus TaxID=1548207 RepID=A0A139SIG8_9BACT|nr:glycine cleavage system protein GcvH [Cephaloticoccus primus]KXU34378.1 glycine cleavage system protein H [Cephaloticoccus primus]